MLVAEYCPYRLNFIFTARTSRAVMHYKDTWFIRITDTETGRSGIGECALFAGLSADDAPAYESVLKNVCQTIGQGGKPDLHDYSSILFGVETAFADLQNGGMMKPFPSAWSKGESSICINGLIWMGDAYEMKRRVREKLEAGFHCLKFKIGGIDFEDELSIIKSVREEFSAESLEIRLDANGAFTPENALNKLDLLSRFTIHSLEQPIKAGQPEPMRHICADSPIPIALDEELIGVNPFTAGEAMLDYLKPAYIILKPSLCGAFSGADKWIDIAERNGIGWWATSALESNIGLNAIAQWMSCKETSMPQGLGTGGLYSNNIPSPLTLKGEQLYSGKGVWQIPNLSWRTI